VQEDAGRSGDGCARAGALDAIEKDASCAIPSPDPRDVQTWTRFLALSVRPDASQIVPGGMTNLRVMITNTGTREAPVVLESRPPSALGRPDWARLSGTSAPQPGNTTDAGETFRVSFVVRTLDAQSLPTDRLPLLPPSSEPQVRYLRVRLAPGASLSQLLPWWALGIPAPYPPFKDDAGRRIVPQTAPRPLAPGDYTVRVEIPLYGSTAQERTVSASIRVKTPD
jgi:hypothetical protein